MKISDSHFHLDSSQPLKKSVDLLRKKSYSNNIENLLVISLKDEPWTYKEFCQEIEKVKNVYYVREIDPTENYKKVFNEISASNASGIKLHPRLRNFNLKNKNLYQIIERCENINLDIVVICSFWDGAWNKYKLSENQFADLADTFPNQKFLWAHSGGHKILDFMFMARRRQNVFLDSSFTQNYFFSGSVFSDLIYSINSLPDKFLFGSDFEHLDYKKTLDELVSKFKKNGIEKDVIEKLMFSNFERLFNDNG